MFSGIPLDSAALVSTVLEGVLYGVSLLLFVFTILVITQGESYHKSNLNMVWVAVALMVSSTAHMIINVIRADDGLIRYRNTPGGLAPYFADIFQNTFMIKNAIYIFQTLLADGVVVYRCYVVWNSIWIVIVPLILWCSIAVTGILPFYCISRGLDNASKGLICQQSWSAGVSFLSTLTANFVSAGLLAYRIWTIERNFVTIQPLRQISVIPFLRVFVDAALLYSATLFTALICYVTSNNGEYVMLDMVVPIISISFYMVLIRTALRQEAALRLRYTGDSDTVVDFRPTDHWQGMTTVISSYIFILD